MRILDFQILFGLIENYKPASGKSDPSRDNSNYVRLLIVSLAVIVGRLELLVSEKLKVHSMIETRHLKNIVIFMELFSYLLRSNKNQLIFFGKQLGNKGKRKFSASRDVFPCNILGRNKVTIFLS